MQAIKPASAGASDVKILLDRDDLPKAWYNILPDLPAPFPPYLHPGTKEPVPPQAFEPLFPKELIRQEMSPNHTEPIPEELRHAGEGVHGPGLLRPEAVPKVRDAPLRRRSDPESERSDEHREEDPGPGSEPSRLPGRRDLGGDRDRRDEPEHPVLPRLRPEP